jgi:hypothetical protein
MSRVLDFNPLTGERVLFDYDAHTDQMVLTHQQDVRRELAFAHAKATDDRATKHGIKNDLWHYARVPNIVIMEMKQKHGVDFFDRNHKKKVFQLLNTEYAYCKTTDKHHA